MALDELPGAAAAILSGARRGVLSTADETGRPHSVPVCFVLHDGAVVSSIDRKPKSGRGLVRLRNIAANPRVCFLADRWDEDWTRLGWVMVRGEAKIGPLAATLWDELVAKYPQYRSMARDEHAIQIRPVRVLWWTWR